MLGPTSTEPHIQFPYANFVQQKRYYRIRCPYAISIQGNYFASTTSNKTLRFSSSVSSVAGPCNVLWFYDTVGSICSNSLGFCDFAGGSEVLFSGYHKLWGLVAQLGSSIRETPHPVCRKPRDLGK
jgi:hypothetical protein